MNRFITLLIWPLSLLAGFTQAASDSSLRVDWELRSRDRSEIASRGYSVVSNNTISGSGTGDRLREDPDGFFVYSGWTSSEQSIGRYVVLTGRRRPEALVFVLRLPEAIVWCTDWSQWIDALPFSNSDQLDFRLMKTETPLKSAGPPTSKVQLRYRVNSWTTKCADPNSPAGRRMPLEPP